MSVRHLNQNQLAERWNLSPRTLEGWRWRGWGPVYLKLGGRIAYRLEDIESFEATHRHINTTGPLRSTDGAGRLSNIERKPPLGHNGGPLLDDCLPGEGAEEAPVEDDGESRTRRPKRWQPPPGTRERGPSDKAAPSEKSPSAVRDPSGNSIAGVSAQGRQQ
jgi:hypothetical protein